MKVQAPALIAMIYLITDSTSAAEDSAAKSVPPGDDTVQVTQPVPQKLLTQRFDDWSYRCVRSQNSATATSCEVFQAIEVEQNGKQTEVLNLAVSRASGKKRKIDWALVALAPLNIHLPSNFGLQVGRLKPIQARYRNCNHLGCWAIFPAPPLIIESLKKSKSGAALFRLLNGKVVKVVFSLKGFTKAFNALSSGSVPAVPLGEQGRLKK